MLYKSVKNVFLERILFYFYFYLHDIFCMPLKRRKSNSDHGKWTSTIIMERIKCYTKFDNLKRILKYLII